MQKKDLGIIGMSVMGKNLCLNLERNGYFVSIFNRSFEKSKKIVIENPKKNIFCFDNLKEFIFSIEKPRKIFLMIKSGIATDQIINNIVSYLEKDDIIIDLGNSFYKDTIRREKHLETLNIKFIGAGISGGEMGALLGPSIMPGCKKHVYNLVKSIFLNISAKYRGSPCVDYIGPNGSGHYLKMVHNGIEYGDMQIISEAYFILKNLLKIDNKKISDIFDKWNKGELNSYLIEITKKILLKRDKNGMYLLDLISDVARNKGTGKWVCQNALDLEAPLSLITESVLYRYISSLQDERNKASKILYGPKGLHIINNKTNFIEDLRRSLYFSKIISYAQGFSQLYLISIKNKWNLNYENIAKIFRSGCIIRAKFLNNIVNAYKKNKDLKNLLLDEYFSEVLCKYQNSLRNIISISVNSGLSIPAFCSAISYYDSYRSKKLSSNLIQAQRDFFGSHGYERIDSLGTFHTIWI
ncbi:NADP-dependent phosphogluconate dehydrogenase [Buchnera aphidicola (Chaitoregma tattakana)]|uniref:NADP-dependent phosphogluconate dehydrogenase n=1 Tax=Buchnera aphidicola TaxID=9 RepID=UPI0031B86897